MHLQNLLDEVTGQLKKKITIRDESQAGGTLIEAEAPRDKKPNVHSNLIGPTQVNSLVRAGVATEAKKPEPAAAQKEATKAAAAKPKETLTLQEQLDRMQLIVTEEPDEEKEADDEEKTEAQLSGGTVRRRCCRVVGGLVRSRVCSSCSFRCSCPLLALQLSRGR